MKGMSCPFATELCKGGLGLAGGDMRAEFATRESNLRRGSISSDELAGIVVRLHV